MVSPQESVVDKKVLENVGSIITFERLVLMWMLQMSSLRLMKSKQYRIDNGIAMFCVATFI